jgi:hypothetical protein
MVKLDIDYSYFSLERAGLLLGVSVADLIHAGAFDQLQICANIYSRHHGTTRERIDENLELYESDLNEIDLADAKATEHIEKWGDWWTRLKLNLMPAGVFEICAEDLRLFEMPEMMDFELIKGYKSDEIGMWKVEFTDPVKISRTDMVILASEITRLQKMGGINISLAEKPLARRERTSYLNIIGALLAQLTAGKANDTSVINQTIQDHGTKYGLSKRNLERVFAEAKRSLGAS